MPNLCALGVGMEQHDEKAESLSLGSSLFQWVKGKNRLSMFCSTSEEKKVKELNYLTYISQTILIDD